ncbi:hypothetical protein EMCRGX_G000891 [Ephydatia muelleri]
MVVVHEGDMVLVHEGDIWFWCMKVTWFWCMKVTWFWCMKETWFWCMKAEILSDKVTRPLATEIRNPAVAFLNTTWFLLATSLPPPSFGDHFVAGMPFLSNGTVPQLPKPLEKKALTPEWRGVEQAEATV